LSKFWRKRQGEIRETREKKKGSTEKEGENLRTKGKKVIKACMRLAYWIKS